MDNINVIIDNFPNSKTKKLYEEHKKYSKKTINLRHFQKLMKKLKENKEVLSNKGKWSINWEHEYDEWEKEDGIKLDKKTRKINIALMKLNLPEEEAERRFGDEIGVQVEFNGQVKNFDSIEKAEKFLKTI